MCVIHTRAWLTNVLRWAATDTLARLAVARSKDIGSATKDAGVSHTFAQSASLINDATGQSCLFADNQALLSLRFLQSTADGFKPKQEQFAEDDENPVMYIPGIGTYHGWHDIVEYR